jgi:hypothetical protein
MDEMRDFDSAAFVMNGAPPNICSVSLDFIIHERMFGVKRN